MGPAHAGCGSLDNTSTLTLDGLGGPLAALSLGSPGGRPVLALHGWLDNAASFVPLADHLPGRHIVALDFPGHGHSAHRPPGMVYHFVDYVADVAHAVKSLGWRQLTLLGHSLGANVAMVFAATCPELVDRLVLIDGVGPTSGDADQAVARLRDALESGLSANDGTRRAYPDWPTLIRARQQASPISAESAELLVRRGAERAGGEIRMRSDRRLRQPSPLYLGESVVSAFAGAVEAPTLLILAREGVIRARAATRQRIALFRNITVKELPGQHHLHMDSPALVGEEVRQFIS